MRCPSFTAFLTLGITLALYLPLAAEIAGEVLIRNYLPPNPAIRSAGMIFSGTVLKIEHLTPAGSPGVTQITFRVQSAIRGSQRGQNLVIREWAGLWSAGERYRVGERVLLFLYPKSKLGLTSPVGGVLGRYEIDHAGRVIMPGALPRPKPIHIKDVAAEVRRLAQGQ